MSDVQPLLTTVPREYVHRAAVAEVLLSGWETDGDDCFRVEARWPSGHSLFVREGGCPDPLLIAESVRQVGLLLSHAAYGAPFGHQFLMHRLSYSAEPGTLTSGAVPDRLELRTRCHDITTRGPHLSSMRYEVTVLRDGQSMGEAEAAFHCLAPAVYRRLRGGRPTSGGSPAPATALPASAVGRSHPANVVLDTAGGGRPGRWALRVDPTHPVFFDHPLDHVPGLLLVEAARQAAHLVTPARHLLPVASRSTFHRYVELDRPCWIEAEVPRWPTSAEAADRIPVRITGIQEATTVFDATVTMWSPR